jgi:hypothetical protein
LCDRLAVRLHGRALAAARLELELALDRALLGVPAAGADASPAEYETRGHHQVLSMELPSPIARAPDLLSIVRARLEGCLLSAPVVAVTLRAPNLARAPVRTLDLLTPEPKADRELPRLVAELSAELGEGVVGVLALVDTWSPAERTRLKPLEGTSMNRDHAESGVSAANHFLVTTALEPSRLIHAAAVPRATLDGGQHLARFEAVEWWRQPVQCRDLFAAWIAIDAAGRGDKRDGALAWLELSAYPGACPLLRGWID